MGIKSVLSKPFAAYIMRGVRADVARAQACQQTQMQHLIHAAKNTAFGKEHGFSDIKTHDDFQKQIPLRDYEQIKPYITRIIEGERDVLWQGVPLYFAKTSGTTSGVKYIPISSQSIHNHIDTARNALLCYINETGKSRFADGKMIFLSGSPVLQKAGNIAAGRLSGISTHHVPKWLQSNRLPSYPTNCIEDWEEKLDRIVEETLPHNMTLISGIPPWVQMYFDRLRQKRNGKTIKQIFPNFDLFVYGGVNFAPYRAGIEEAVGTKIDSVELFPASEGFFAFQDQQNDSALLLNVNSGIFFEFVPADRIFDANPPRIPLWDVKIGVNYALIVNNNAGLWSYNIGDTVRFTSLNPPKIVVTGRIKHYISAFGEHVIGEEVEYALTTALSELGGRVAEFTVAPMVNPSNGQLPYHEWLIEFEQEPDNLPAFAARTDELMCQKNIYYADLIKGGILQVLQIKPLPKGAFQAYMKSIGKLGGQNKVPRLSDNRDIADHLAAFKGL